jgi:hypothetical protein
VLPLLPSVSSNVRIKLPLSSEREVWQGMSVELKNAHPTQTSVVGFQQPTAVFELEPKTAAKPLLPQPPDRKVLPSCCAFFSKVGLKK